MIQPSSALQSDRVQMVSQESDETLLDDLVGQGTNNMAKKVQSYDRQEVIEMSSVE